MQSSPDDYDDGRELTEYIARNRWCFLTPFEQRAESLGIRREKARHMICESPDAPGGWAVRVLKECDAPANDALRDAIGDDLESFRRFREEVTNRIESAFKHGELFPCRCPECNRIVKTPKAKQCLWCGHAWHEEERKTESPR